VTWQDFRSFILLFGAIFDSRIRIHKNCYYLLTFIFVLWYTFISEGLVEFYITDQAPENQGLIFLLQKPI